MGRWVRASAVAASLAVALAAVVVATGGPRGIGAAQPAQGQETRPPEVAGITVLGDGVARGAPDTTTLQLGVQSSARTAADALNQARDTTERVLQRLRDRGVPEANLQTSGLSVYPLQGPGKDGIPDPTAVTGYRGSAAITVQVKDVNQAGPLLTAALDAGANVVQGLQWGIGDDTQLRRQALAAAIADARPRAEEAATAAGLRIAGIRSIVEEPVGPPKGAYGLGGGGGPGMAAGELGVAVRAQVTFDVAR
jgi:uncharacterized protein YggE